MLRFQTKIHSTLMFKIVKIQSFSAVTPRHFALSSEFVISLQTPKPPALTPRRNRGSDGSDMHKHTPGGFTVVFLLISSVPSSLWCSTFKRHGKKNARHANGEKLRYRFTNKYRTSAVTN